MPKGHYVRIEIITTRTEIIHVQAPTYKKALAKMKEQGPYAVRHRELLSEKQEIVGQVGTVDFVEQY
jgi:hypothetical protein